MRQFLDYSRFGATSVLAATYRLGRILLPGKTDEKRVDYDTQYLRENRRHIFFGYYDHSPFSDSEQRILAMRTEIKNQVSEAKDRVEIGFYEHEKPELFHAIGESSTWCWQQGCRLRWFPGDDNRVVYNKLVGGDYGCVIQNADSREIESEFTRPLYDLSPDGKWGLSLNFSRLHRLRPGYGYCNLPDASVGMKTPEDDGIWRLDMITGKADLLFSLKQAAEFCPVASMQEAEHYFNHISVSPSGDRFLVFHLWQCSEGRKSRLITCDSNGSNWCLLNNDGMTSHYTWKDSETILDYALHNETGRRFYEYKDLSGDRRIVGEGILMGDGHPSYSPDRKWILVDTYPDKYREQHLYLFNEESEDLVEIGRFFSPMSFWRDLRCDLHPRWSPSGRYVCVDVPQKSGFRAMAVLDVRNIVGEQ